MKATVQALVLFALLGAWCCAPKSNENSSSTDSTTSTEDTTVAVSQPEKTAEAQSTVPSNSNEAMEDNFALVFSDQGDQPWDPAFLSMLDAGVTVIFFGSNGEVFGKAVGTDMDSYFLKGTYKLLTATDGQPVAVKKVSVNGEVIVYMEGEGERERNKLEGLGIQIEDKGNRVLLSTDFSFRQRFANTEVVKQTLTREELAKAKAALIIF